MKGYKEKLSVWLRQGHLRKAIAMLCAALLCVAVTMASAGPTDAASKVKLNTTKKTVYIGTPYTLKVTGTKKEAKWSSSNKKVATVTQKGVVKGKKKGTATITAKVGSKKLKCKVMVKQPVASVKLNKASVSLTKKGQAVQLKATVKPGSASSKKLKWATSDKKVATVTQKGVVKAVGNGRCYVYATAADRGEVKAKCVVKVAVKGTAAACDHKWVAQYETEVTEPEFDVICENEAINGTNIKVTYTCSCGKIFTGSNETFEQKISKTSEYITTGHYLTYTASLEKARKQGIVYSDELGKELDGFLVPTWGEKDDTGYQALKKHIAEMDEKGEYHTYGAEVDYEPSPYLFTLYRCSWCGEWFYTVDDWYEHCMANQKCQSESGHDFYEGHNASVYYETREIITPAKITKTLTGYKCSKCGATK